MKTIDISGMGGGYEFTCQEMLANGMRWLKEHPDFTFAKTFRSFEGVHGFVEPMTDAAKELEEAIVKKLRWGDATGGQYHSVLNHLMYIHHHGHDKWITTISKNDAGRVYEFDGTPESCPPGYIPKPGDPPDSAFKAGMAMGKKLKRDDLHQN